MIENFFIKNKNHFFDRDLPEGHLERFEQKLNKLHTYADNKRKLKVFLMAASVILFVSTLIFLNKKLNYILPKNHMLALTRPEMSETEQYYINAISEKIKKLNQNEKISYGLTADLREIDNTMKNINKDLTLNPGDDRLVEAAINVYQAKLDLLDDIISHTR
jgi:hypothetical protein